MEEKGKIHKINVVIATNDDWESKDVAEQVAELLRMDNEDDGPFENIHAKPDPANEDTETQTAIEESLTLIEFYAGVIRIKVENHRGLGMFWEGIEKVEHGITDLKACVRSAKFIANKTSDVQVAKLGLQDLDEAPPEILHAIAHSLGLEEGECSNMSPDDMADWIKSAVAGPPKTVN